MTFDLPWLLSPISTERFFAQYYEKQLLHIQGEGRQEAAKLFSWDALEQLLWSHEHEAQDFVRLMEEGAEVHYGTREANLSQWLIRQHQRGCTLVVNNIQKRWVPVAALAREIEARAGIKINVNAYITPPKAQGFVAHFDTHDTFILQVEGSKRWALYGTHTELPTESQVERVTALGEPEGQVLLLAGELLYLPRGIIHEPVTLEQPSFHLTIGLYPLRWIDLLKEMLDLASERDVALRRSVPRQAEALDAAKGEVFAKVSQLLDDPRHFQETQDRWQMEQTSRRRALPLGLFHTPRQSQELTIDGRLQKRPGMFATFSRSEKGVSLTFPSFNTLNESSERHAGKLFMHRMFAPALQWLVRVEGPFALRDIPELDDALRLVLGKQLVKLGFLEPA